MMELICVDISWYGGCFVCWDPAAFSTIYTIYNVTVTDQYQYLVQKGFYLYHSRILKEGKLSFA